MGDCLPGSSSDIVRTIVHGVTSMSPGQSTTVQRQNTPALELIASRQLVSWLAEQQISLSFTT